LVSSSNGMPKRELNKSPSQLSRFERTSLGAAKFAFILTIIVVNVYFFLYASHGLQIKWPTTYAEGTVVAGISRVINNEELYVDFNNFPHLLTYPFLFSL
jgi:hypothetical protein